MNMPPKYYDTRYTETVSPFNFIRGGMNSVRDNATLYIPKGSSSAYSKAIDWREFKNVVEIEPTSVELKIMDGDTKEILRYTVDGQRLDHPQKGINIVRYNDGTVHKVLVK